MTIPQIVIDTNVLVAAFKSRQGASFRLISAIDSGRFNLNVSVPLVLEYEDVLLRPEHDLPIEDVGNVIDYICKVSRHHQIHFLWRPYLPDPNDDLILELAVTAGCEFIVTFNQRDFRNINPFGIKVVPPKEILEITGVI